MPLHSTSCDVSGIYGRRIDLSNGGPIEQHIGQGFFNARALKQFDEWIGTATVLDEWTFYAGLPNFSSKHLTYVKPFTEGQ